WTWAIALHMSAFGGKADIFRADIKKTLLTQRAWRSPQRFQFSRSTFPLAASITGCSADTGSDAGNVFCSASSSAFSLRPYSRLPRSMSSRLYLYCGLAIIWMSRSLPNSELIAADRLLDRSCERQA